MWKFHRRHLNICFTLKLLQSFVPVFNESSSKMVDNMKKFLETEKEFDLYKIVGKCTLNMICCKYYLILI